MADLIVPVVPEPQTPSIQSDTGRIFDTYVQSIIGSLPKVVDSESPALMTIIEQLQKAGEMLIAATSTRNQKESAAIIDSWQVLIRQIASNNALINALGAKNVVVAEQMEDTVVLDQDQTKWYIGKAEDIEILSGRLVAGSVKKVKIGMNPYSSPEALIAHAEIVHTSGSSSVRVAYLRNLILTGRSQAQVYFAGRAVVQDIAHLAIEDADEVVVYSHGTTEVGHANTLQVTPNASETQIIGRADSVVHSSGGAYTFVTQKPCIVDTTSIFPDNVWLIDIEEYRRKVTEAEASNLQEFNIEVKSPSGATNIAVFSKSEPYTMWTCTRMQNPPSREVIDEQIAQILNSAPSDSDRTPISPQIESLIDEMGDIESLIDEMGDIESPETTNNYQLRELVSKLEHIGVQLANIVIDVPREEAELYKKWRSLIAKITANSSLVNQLAQMNVFFVDDCYNTTYNANVENAPSIQERRLILRGGTCFVASADEVAIMGAERAYIGSASFVAVTRNTLVHLGQAQTLYASGHSIVYGTRVTHRIEARDSCQVQVVTARRPLFITAYSPQARILITNGAHTDLVAELSYHRDQIWVPKHQGSFIAAYRSATNHFAVEMVNEKGVVENMTFEITAEGQVIHIDTPN